MSRSFSKFDMLFTVKDNIKCLNNKNNNNFIIRNNKIYFLNNHANKTLDTTAIAVHNSNFEIVSNDSNLSFGFDNSDNKITINGSNFYKVKEINNKMIDFYSGPVTITIPKNMTNRFMYVLDQTNTLYKIVLVYNELCRDQFCVSDRYQTYASKLLGKEIKLTSISELSNNVNCSYNKVHRIRKLNEQQNLYTMMRLHPDKFPIISSVKNMNLTYAQQRAYSNYWWRQYGTSQALPVNDVWGGFNLVGSDVPYTH